MNLSNTQKEKYIEFLAEFVSENKKEKMEKVLNSRTRRICLVLEDLFQPHNASATMRTSECLGIQDIHIIENRNTYTLNNNVTQGSSKWISTHRYRDKAQNNTKICMDNLKEKGYKIIATNLSNSSISLDEIDLDQKVAIMFGTEEVGLTNYALENADAHLKLPMYGFTQSYNISVSVAIAFSNLIERLRNTKTNWHLSQDEKLDLTIEWYRKCIKKVDIIEKDFLREL